MPMRRPDAAPVGQPAVLRTPEARELLSRLLEKYETSPTVFERPAPWAQDRILKFTPETFPEAFAPTGAEGRRQLIEGARALAEAGAIRIRWHTDFAKHEPREFRLGPAEIAPAYAVATAWGFRPLREAFTAIAGVAAALRTGTPAPAPWMATWLAGLEAALVAGDPAPLGVSRERCKSETTDLGDALRAAAAISGGRSGWERVVSEAVFGDSKRLADLRPAVARFLVVANPEPADDLTGDPEEVLARYGVRRLPAEVRVAGGGVLRHQNSVIALVDAAPALAVPGAWAPALGVALGTAETTVITTIENEYSFQAYVEQAGGPAGLAARGEAALFTNGWPGPPLLDALRVARRERPTLVVRHWGDADVGGLDIWWYLRRQLEMPIPLYRTTAAWADTVLGERPGAALTAGERRALERLRLAWVTCSGDDVAGARALADVLLRHGMKVEQERF